MNLMQIDKGHTVELKTTCGMPEQVHVFDKDSINAVNAALAAARPLLVRGEPGTGKSQLARAAAKVLGRVFVWHVVDSRTESSDLLWRFDAVSRLADAQLFGVLKESSVSVQSRLKESNYVTPGPLWWAFDWTDAVEQAKKVKQEPHDSPDGGNPGNGCVVLVDEIDKAETDVPNGLLEALGAGQFTPMGRKNPVMAGEPTPLVVITTNEERRLPDAFVRRCLVLYLQLPANKDEMINLLVSRGKAHFPKAGGEVLKQSAELLVDDRESARKERLPMPGQAEYLDLVRAVVNLAPGDEKKQIETIKTVAGFTFKKHGDRR